MNVLVAITLLAAGPFVGSETRIEGLRNPSDVSIAATSDAVVLAWNEGGRVRGHANGVTRDLGIGTGASAASSGRDVLIVWLEDNGNRIVGARWSAPTVVQTYVTLSPTTPLRALPQVAWDGTRFLVFGSFESVAAANGALLTTTIRSFPEGYRCIPSGFSVFCAVLPASYSVDWRVGSDTAQHKAGSVTYGGFFSSYGAGATGGNDEFAIAWRTSTSIEGRRINRDAATLSFFSVPVARPLTGRRGPQIAWDGTRYLVVFDMVGETGDIWGAFVVPGRNYIAEPFVIAGSAAQEFSPSVTAIGPDRFVVAYTTGSDAIASRVISFKEPPSRRRAAQ